MILGRHATSDTLRAETLIDKSLRDGDMRRKAIDERIGSTRVALGDDFISLMTLAICCDGARVLTGAAADTTGSLKRFPLLDKRSRVVHD